MKNRRYIRNGNFIICEEKIEPVTNATYLKLRRTAHPIWATTDPNLNYAAPNLSYAAEKLVAEQKCKTGYA
jgi:hypothetical protein